MRRMIGPVVLGMAVLWDPGSLRAQDEMEARHAAEIGLKPGMVLDSSTAKLAKDLLPPEIYARYETNDYRNEIAEWAVGSDDADPRWQAASAENATHLDVTDKGTIVDKRSGEQPRYVYGTPFPGIDSTDPKAPMKIVWNYFYNAVYRNGNIHNFIYLTWLNASGVDRNSGQHVYFKFYDGAPPELRQDNPNNFLMQYIANSTSPADLHGTTALSWRYRDPDKRDNVWAYVPALRRVRATSPTNRSDGFLGSDMSQDDGPFFDGKVEDFEWKLLGERETLCLVDPVRLEGSGKIVPLEKGGYRTILPEAPTFGFQRPSWDGAAWAPIALKLARRRTWVVEAKPKDSYYLYGRLELWIDQAVWGGCWNRKFSWQGELLGDYHTFTGPGRKSPDGKHVFFGGPGGGVVANTAVNQRMNRATVAQSPPGTKNPYDNMVPYDPGFFDHQTLHRLGQ